MNIFQKIRPLNFYKNDRAVFNEAAKGTLTSRRLLEIEYGEYPPKGINIANDNNRPVSIRGYFEDQANSKIGAVILTLVSLGYVDGKPKTPTGETTPVSQNKDRTIYLNRLLNSPVGQAGVFKFIYAKMAHLIAFQAFMAGMYKMPFLLEGAAIIIGSAATYPLLAAAFISSLRLQPLIQILTLPFRPAMDTIGHEHVHVLQVHDSKETGFNPLQSNLCKNLDLSSTFWRKTVRTIDAVLSFGTVPYLKSDAEIQARLHTVLAKGYRKQWKKLPATRHQLWAALITQGLYAPAAIRKELQETRDSEVKDFYRPGLRGAFHRVADRNTNAHVAELNAVYRNLLRDPQKEAFWRDVLPTLYGHLLELYGDPDGRDRMGWATYARKTEVSIHRNQNA